MLIGTIVLVAVLAGSAWVGLRVREDRSNLDDFVTARGSQRPLALGLSFFASGMGAWILFAPPEVGAFVGLVAVVGYALAAAGPFVAFAVLGRRVREVIPRGHSLTEFVRLRFGRAFRSYVFVISVLYMFFFLAAELSAVGAVGAITAGIDARFTIIAVAATTLAYTAYGGLRASLATDRWQAWLVLALVGIATVAGLVALDAPISTVAASGLVGIDRIGVEAAIALVIAVTTANLFHQGYWQRLWAARDRRTVTVGAGIGVGLTIPVMLLVGVVGIAAAGAGLDLGDPPAPLFALMAELAPWVAVAVLALGVALVCSSVDTLENAIASLVVSERPSTTVSVARIATAAVVIPAAVIALQGYSVLRLFLIADLFCAATVVPALLGLWRRATTTAVLAGSIVGLAATAVPGWISTGSLAEGALLATFPDAVPTLPPFAAALVVSTVVAVALSLLGDEETALEELDRDVPDLAGQR